MKKSAGKCQSGNQQAMTATGAQASVHEARPASCYDALIIGAGMSGLYQLYRLRALGMSVRVLEAGTGVGGTWYWNRYPGARFDSESYSYGYSFSAEVLAGVELVGALRGPAGDGALRQLRRRQVRPEARHRIQDAHRRRTLAGSHWNLAADLRGRPALASALPHHRDGPLSAPTLPRIKGVDTFKGEAYHTGLWPKHPVTFEGKRVAVTGTGATGVQTITEIAKTAQHLTVFQRRPELVQAAAQRQDHAGRAGADQGQLSGDLQAMRGELLLLPAQHLSA